MLTLQLLQQGITPSSFGALTLSRCGLPPELFGLTSSVTAPSTSNGLFYGQLPPPPPDQPLPPLPGSSRNDPVLTSSNVGFDDLFVSNNSIGGLNYTNVFGQQACFSADSGLFFPISANASGIGVTGMFQ